MINPTSVNELTRRIAEQSLKQETEKQPKEAHVTDKARFDEAMQNAQTQSSQSPQQPASVQQNADSEAVNQVASGTDQPVTHVRSAGDAILQGLDKMRTDTQQLSTQLQPGVDHKQLSPEQALALQMKASAVMVEEQAVTSGTQKATQNVDSLLKSQ